MSVYLLTYLLLPKCISTVEYTEQLKSVLKSKWNDGPVTHDADFDLTKFAYGTNFVKRIVLHLDLEVTMIHRSATGVLKSLLQSVIHYRLETLLCG